MQPLFSNLLNCKIMDPTLLNSLLSSGLGASVGGAANIAAMIYQNTYNERMYNQYMSPKAQMAQMRAAGINPAASAQGIAGGSSTAIAPAASATEGAGIAGNLAELVGNSFNSALGAKNIESDTNKNNAETKGQEIQNDFNNQTFDERVAAIAKQNEWTDEQVKQMQAFNKYADDLYNWNSQKAKQDVFNAEKQWELYESQIKKNEKEADLAEAQVGLTEQQTKESAAKTAETWKQVEFQKWFNSYCMENNMQPDSPEAEYIRNKIIANSPYDSLERDNAREWCKNFEQCQHDIQDAKASAITENDPEKMTIQDLKSHYDSEIAEVDKQLKAKRKELSELKHKSWKMFDTDRYILESEISDLETKRKRLTDDYAKNLRRLRSNTSTSVGFTGVSRSE